MTNSYDNGKQCLPRRDANGNVVTATPRELREIAHEPVIVAGFNLSKHFEDARDFVENTANRVAHAFDGPKAPPPSLGQ